MKIVKHSAHTALVKQCLQFLHLRGVFAWQNNTTGIYDPVKKVFRKPKQSLSGPSDILGIIGPSGKLVAVECKIWPDKPKPAQQAFLANVAERNGHALVVYDLKELIAWYDRLFVGASATAAKTFAECD